jgi:hypothetical protein
MEVGVVCRHPYWPEVVANHPSGLGLAWISSPKKLVSTKVYKTEIAF